MINRLFESSCVLSLVDNVTHCPTAAVDVEGLFCGASLTQNKSEQAADLRIMLPTLGDTFATP